MMQAHTRLPSLKALQAFEAAARLSSFTAAAGARLARGAAWVSEGDGGCGEDVEAAGGAVE